MTSGPVSAGSDGAEKPRRTDPIERFEAALKAHTDEYKRVEELWRQRRADVMDLLCKPQQEALCAARDEVVFHYGIGPQFRSNDAVLREAVRLRNSKP